MCGEQHGLVRHGSAAPGSPPRVRGTVQVSVHLVERHRITPACAGNRYSHLKPCLYLRDHPRVCGEQTPARYAATRKPGSPPRVRGTGQKLHSLELEGRITPACAGNSPYLRRSPRTARDHPRVCGEQCTSGGTIGLAAGSPPRVRGTARYLLINSSIRRITPACAGNRFKEAAKAILD